MTEQKSFETWAIVEIMGHRQFAGFVSEQAIGGTSFVRVDVPAVVSPDGDHLPAFTKMLGAGSIYAISPCTEETAKAWTARQRQRSFGIYEAPRLAAPATITAEPEGKHCVDCGCELSPSNSSGVCADCLEDECEDDELA